MAFITEWLQPTGNFTLPLRTGYTYNMVVDWGDGSPTSTVLAYNAAEATHNYLTAGTYQISITGTCGAWYINNNATNKTRIKKVLAWGNVGFTGAGLQNAFKGCAQLTQLPAGSITGAANVSSFIGTFQTCTGLTAIPAGLFDLCVNIAGMAFYYTFQGCTNLTTIPADLFRYNILAAELSFNFTFQACSKLATIPDDLFRYNILATSDAFSSTFSGCTLLTAIPADLFRYNILINNYSFSSTFQDCITLTAIPADLFRYNTQVIAFYATFQGCTSLTTIPADSFRYNILVTTFQSCFQGCTNLTTIPADLFRYNAIVTNYNGTFRYCNKLQINKNIFYADGEQSTRFLNKSVVFTTCFERASFTGIQGESPDLWNCNFGTGTPTKTNVFAGLGNKPESILNYCSIPNTWGTITTSCPKIEFLHATKTGANTLKISVATAIEKPVTDEIICYFSFLEAGLNQPENIITLTTANNILFETTINIDSDAQAYFIQAEYYFNGVLSETKNFEGTFFVIVQKETTIINITDPNNHVTLNNPNHNFNHGLIHYNGFIYGTARGISIDPPANQHQIFKLKANDYSVLIQNTCFLYKNSEEIPLYKIESVVYCLGFLWGQSTGYIIRINPSDLDYMVFQAPAGICDRGQPIGTDGRYLFVNSNTSIQKLDALLMIDPFINYGYDGSTYAQVPILARLETCLIVQYDVDPFKQSYVHSILTDNDFIYLAVTTGYNFHFQKVNKTTMLTVNDVLIPTCTDDMVQNNDFVFLAPEATFEDYGTDWGLLAIRKTNLEIKFLKALHTDFYNNLDLRKCFGVFYYNNYISVQLITSKKTILIKLDNIENWGEDFPIGGATEAIYTFQINGIDLAFSPNEMLIDDANWVHVNTWEPNTQVFKYPLGLLIPESLTFNALSLFHNNTTALLQLLSKNCGHSVRCVQDAPGVANGTTGTETDQDGNIYNTIVINEKRWFVENLKTTHYRNAAAIPDIQPAGEWAALATGARCSYNNINP